MTRKAASSLDNRMAYYSRREAFKAFAGLLSIPLMLCLAAVFDGGAAGQIIRSAIELAVA